MYGRWLFVNKAKLIAISGMCSAVATSCLLLVGLVPAMRWAMLFLGVIASIAVVIPLMINPKNLVYSLLVYLAASVLGIFLGIANVLYVAPIVVFCMPFAIVKVCGETVKVTLQSTAEQTLEDPFGQGDDKKVVSFEVQGKPRLPKVVKWILYFVLLEAGIGLSLLLTYLFTPAVFETVVTAKWFWWAIGVIQLIVYPYDVLMHACLVGTTKLLRKVIKPE